MEEESGIYALCPYMPLNYFSKSIFINCCPNIVSSQWMLKKYLLIWLAVNGMLSSSHAFTDYVLPRAFFCFYIPCEGLEFNRMGLLTFDFPVSWPAYYLLLLGLKTLEFPSSSLPALVLGAASQLQVLFTVLRELERFPPRCGVGEGWGASLAVLRVASYFPSRKESPVGVRKQSF